MIVSWNNLVTDVILVQNLGICNISAGVKGKLSFMVLIPTTIISESSALMIFLVLEHSIGVKKLNGLNHVIYDS